MITIAMLVAMGRMEELKLHIRATRNTGVTREEVKEIMMHAAIYAGVPPAFGSFQIAAQIFDEMDKEAREDGRKRPYVPAISIRMARCNLIEMAGTSPAMTNGGGHDHDLGTAQLAQRAEGAVGLRRARHQVRAHQLGRANTAATTTRPISR